MEEIIPRATLPDPDMPEILLSTTLRTRGYSGDDLNRMCRRGDLTRLRRGAYAAPADELSAEQQHRRLIMATVPQQCRDVVLSHHSAAVWHGLPVWLAEDQRVHITRTRTGGGKKRSMVQIHTSPLPADDVVLVRGVRVTTLARTVVDLSRALRFDQAVAIGDRALNLGLQIAELFPVLDAAYGWPGIRHARRVVGFLDPRSESVGESISRVRCYEAQLPPPSPQYEVFDQRGVLVGRCDFGWQDQQTLGEFDGQIKYGRLLKPGQQAQDVIYAEKVREDALRDLGWQVVRWTWADLHRPNVIAERLRRAFVRAERMSR